MNAIFHFENHPNVANLYRVKHLEPRLTTAGLRDQTKIIFQDYLDRDAPGAPLLMPTRVAAKAAETRQQMTFTPKKTVFILDLDGPGSNTPDSSYGLCVLLSLAYKFRLSIEQFIGNQTFLVAILTLFPSNLSQDNGVSLLPHPRCDLQTLHALWPKTSKIHNQTPSRVTSGETARALTAVKTPGPRIILANSGNDNAWLAELIVSWLV